MLVCFVDEETRHLVDYLVSLGYESGSWWDRFKVLAVVVHRNLLNTFFLVYLCLCGLRSVVVAA